MSTSLPSHRPFDRKEAEAKLLGQAVALYMAGMTKGALRFIDQITLAVENEAHRLCLRATFLLELEDVEGARKDFAKACKMIEPERTSLFWTPDCLIHNRHWSEAMKRAGRQSLTFMNYLASAINRVADFDLYFSDVLPEWCVPETTFGRWSFFRRAMAFLHLLQHASVIHVPVSGGPLGVTPMWDMEADLLHTAGIKIVVMPYGQDYYLYSRLHDSSLRHVQLAHYPTYAWTEAKIAEHLRYWEENADCVICGFMIDNIARWDVTTFTMFHVDTDLWQAKTAYSDADGRSGPVRIIHTPNHRVCKGSEYVVDAVHQLQKEGLKVELKLIERMQNHEVREAMRQADILAEQFIHPAYSLSGIEGMASGLAVMANLDSEFYTRVYRRFSYLNECPILSTTLETMVDNMRLLVTRPDLRRQLGEAGRLYAVKYHSLEAAAFLFGSVYRKILGGEDVDLLNLFHPLTSDYVRTNPISHPLVENRFLNS